MWSPRSTSHFSQWVPPLHDGSVQNRVSPHDEISSLSVPDESLSLNVFHWGALSLLYSSTVLSPALHWLVAQPLLEPCRPSPPNSRPLSSARLRARRHQGQQQRPQQRQRRQSQWQPRASHRPRGHGLLLCVGGGAPPPRPQGRACGCLSLPAGQERYLPCRA